MPKLLGEFLQEQQEPFNFEVYLHERRYHGGRSRKNALTENSETRQENAIEDRISSASNVGDMHCPEADTRRSTKHGDLFLEGKVDGDTKLKWRAEEDSKQLSPVSVLDKTESDEDSPKHDKQYSLKTAQGESSNSISQSKLKKSRPYSFELVSSNSYDQYMINKRDLQQRKQLLIDCVREFIEKHKKRDKSIEELKKVFGAQELWKLVCDNVWIWSQNSINESNILHLLHSDFLASADEWNADSEQHKMDISIEVGNAILEDVINEIVTW